MSTNSKQSSPAKSIQNGAEHLVIWIENILPAKSFRLSLLDQRENQSIHFFLDARVLHRVLPKGGSQ